MIPIDAVRTAALSDQPWSRLDELVRKELDAGRTTRQIFDELNGMREEIRRTPELSEDGDDALGDTLDALIGFCNYESAYKNPPILPSEEEILRLPNWARVAFAARCARRILPLFALKWVDAPRGYVERLNRVITLAEMSAARTGKGEDWAPPAGILTCMAYACDAVNNAGHNPARAAEVINAMDLAIAKFKDQAENIFEPYIGDLFNAILTHVSGAIASRIAKNRETYDAAVLTANSFIRRDFDHLVHLAEWQQWTDETTVSPEIFGPLWPDSPPPGWPAEPRAFNFPAVVTDGITI